MARSRVHQSNAFVSARIISRGRQLKGLGYLCAFRWGKAALARLATRDNFWFTASQIRPRSAAAIFPEMENALYAVRLSRRRRRIWRRTRGRGCRVRDLCIPAGWRCLRKCTWSLPTLRGFVSIPGRSYFTKGKAGKSALYSLIVFSRQSFVTPCRNFWWKFNKFNNYTLSPSFYLIP